MYYLVYGLLYIISLLPLKVLYLFSDLVFLLAYHVVGYRKDVVMKNLAIAFPEKTDEERAAIARGFYRSLCDFFVETIKLFSASDAWVNRHITGDYSEFHRLHAEGKKCQVLLGHSFNWEIGYQSFVMNFRQKPLGVYMPLTNSTFDAIFRKLRGQRGGYLLSATDFKNAIAPFKNDPYALLLVADQSPSGPENGIWVPFFGRPTNFVRGPENAARANDLPVLFCLISKVKRGHYKISFELAVEHGGQTQKGELTKQYAVFLEKAMREQPQNWLWTHRRWKWEWAAEHGTYYN